MTILAISLIILAIVFIAFAVPILWFVWQIAKADK